MVWFSPIFFNSCLMIWEKRHMRKSTIRGVKCFLLFRTVSDSRYAWLHNTRQWNKSEEILNQSSKSHVFVSFKVNLNFYYKRDREEKEGHAHEHNHDLSKTCQTVNAIFRSPYGQSQPSMWIPIWAFYMPSDLTLLRLGKNQHLVYDSHSIHRLCHFSKITFS